VSAASSLLAIDGGRWFNRTAGGTTALLSTAVSMARSRPVSVKAGIPRPGCPPPGPPRPSCARTSSISSIRACRPSSCSELVLAGHRCRSMASGFTQRPARKCLGAWNRL